MIRKHKYEEEMPMDSLYKYCIELIENNTIVYYKDWQQFSFFLSCIHNMRDDFKYIKLGGYKNPYLFLDTSDQLYELITRRIKYKDIKSMILHLFTTTNGINTHVDNISKKCILIPVKCSIGSKFHESNHECDLNSLSNTHYITFNDHKQHGIYSGYGDHKQHGIYSGYDMVISVD